MVCKLSLKDGGEICICRRGRQCLMLLLGSIQALVTRQAWRVVPDSAQGFKATIGVRQDWRAEPDVACWVEATIGNWAREGGGQRLTLPKVSR